MATVFVVDSKGNIALVKRGTNSISSKGDKADFHFAHKSKDIAKAQIFTWAVAPRDSLLDQVRPESGWVIYFSFSFSFLFYRGSLALYKDYRVKPHNKTAG